MHYEGLLELVSVGLAEDGTEITDGNAQSITFDDAHDLLWAHNSPEAEEAVGC